MALILKMKIFSSLQVTKNVTKLFTSYSHFVIWKEKTHPILLIYLWLYSLVDFPWHDAGFLGKCYLAVALLDSSPSLYCSYTLRHTNSLDLTATTQSDSKISCTTSMYPHCTISLYIFFFTMSNNYGLSTPPSFLKAPHNAFKAAVTYSEFTALLPKTTSQHILNQSV